MKRKRIRKVDLCGIQYKVVYYPAPGRPGRKEVDDCVVGFIDNDKREIHLEVGRKQDGNYILFHELVHGAIEAIMADPNTKEFLKYYGEGFVRPFARVLFSMLKSAGLMAKGF